MIDKVIQPIKIERMLTLAHQTASRRVLTEILRWSPLVAVLLWVYGPMFPPMVQQWWDLPACGHGFFVAPFAGFLLWYRRDLLRNISVRGSWWGALFLAVSAGMQWFAAYKHLNLPQRLSLLPCLAGIVLFVWGWRALRWAAPSIVFLIFMYPITGVLFDNLSLPLQRGATALSAFVLRIVGIPAFGEGTVLNLPGVKPLGVEAACCGLRMIVTCLAICFGASFFMQKSLREKVIIVASSVPIAVLVNVVRITVTGVVAYFGNYNYAVTAFHDSVGLFTMPLAIALLWTETWALTLLFGGNPRPQK